MKKKLLFLISLLFIAVLLAACGGDSNSSNEGVDDENNDSAEESSGDKTLTVLVEGGSPAETVAKETSDSFKEETGYEVIIESVPYTGVYDRMRTELTTGAGAFDVATIDTIWLPALYKGLDSRYCNRRNKRRFIPRFS